MSIRKVAVYCASSRQVASVFFDAARCLGKLLAEHGVTIVYGGGTEELMIYIALLPRFVIGSSPGGRKMRDFRANTRQKLYPFPLL
jgi:hypothetical protein